jgi:hypothetical protein
MTTPGWPQRTPKPRNVTVAAAAIGGAIVGLIAGAAVMSQPSPKPTTPARPAPVVFTTTVTPPPRVVTVTMPPPPPAPPTTAAPGNDVYIEPDWDRPHVDGPNILNPCRHTRWC